MKIRTDFVTNSSSVSFLITMHKDVLEVFENIKEESEVHEITKVKNTLKKHMLETGTRAYLEGEEIYLKKIEFQTDNGDAYYREDFEAEFENINYKTIDDDVLWKLIRGEYILNKGIVDINGFGITQVYQY